jgi:hypothetical protein
MLKRTPTTCSRTCKITHMHTHMLLHNVARHTHTHTHTHTNTHALAQRNTTQHNTGRGWREPLWQRCHSSCCCCSCKRTQAHHATQTRKGSHVLSCEDITPAGGFVRSGGCVYVLGGDRSCLLHVCVCVCVCVCVYIQFSTHYTSSFLLLRFVM